MQDMISLFRVHMPESVNSSLLQVLHSGFIGQGPKVEEFELVLRKYFDHPHVLTLNSGTSGLHLAARLIGIGPGDEVITTAMTCTATNMPILERGGKIVWADVDPVTGLIDPKDIEKKITKKTKAIFMVHFGGIPCDIQAINRLAKAHGIAVVEDAAHAFGAEYAGKKIGVHSDYVMFSLQAIKHITTIDGGLLLVKDQKEYKRGKLIRWYGIDRESKRKDFRCEEDILEFGYKFHMNDIAATIGLEQMKYADKIVAGFQANQRFYDQALVGIPGLRIIPKEKNTVSASWIYTIHVENRDQFIKFMDEHKIMASRVHERNDIHTCFREFKTPLPNLDEFNRTQVSIPVGNWVTEKQREYIVDTIKKFGRK
jgi:perosamine synthetase